MGLSVTADAVWTSDCPSSSRLSCWQAGWLDDERTIDEHRTNERTDGRTNIERTKTTTTTMAMMATTATTMMATKIATKAMTMTGNDFLKKSDNEVGREGGDGDDDEEEDQR
mgnify:CR=1 FL=1